MAQQWTVDSIAADPEWPAATLQHLICDPLSEPDKLARADSLLDVMVRQPLAGLTFLDYGCGEGHLVHLARQAAKSVTGYDLRQQGHYAWGPGALLHTDLPYVRSKAPYDVVLLCDVLDHVEQETAVELLQKVHAMCHAKSRVYIRCHPWCSRHGGHLYTQLNKAFAHLFLPASELHKFGRSVVPTQRVLHPQAEYKSWLMKAGFTVIGEPAVECDAVEPFFMEPERAEVVKAHWRMSARPELATGQVFPAAQMTQTYLDFCVRQS